MNYNKDLGLIYWATAGCARRVGLAVFESLGDRYTWYPWLNEEKLLDIFLHDQGIPPFCDDYQIICAIRNPYTRAVSAYIDLVDEGYSKSFKEYCFQDRYNNYPNDKDLFYWYEWKDLRVPDYFIRLEHMNLDWRSIPLLENKLNNIENLTNVNPVAGEKPLDEYDVNGHQKVTRFMDQEVADLIYDKDKVIFDLGKYDKNSWK